MGNCRSCQSTSIAISSNVKLILQDGQLQEFSHPVKVSQVLQNYSSPSCFICDSDDMEVGEFVCALNGDEELQVGQLYFVLPLKLLKSPFQAKDMAALAVKASLAIEGRCCRRPLKGADPLVFNTKMDAKKGRSSVDIEHIRRGGSSAGGHGGGVVRERKRTGGGRGHGFITTLSVIVE
ncbi:uncharacterized protein LOC107435766 [Ziziphus jujuba]|uniref:Uncharacterized protein LOC107435766 n=2 Tax=Ziziphus jujuba TaxID=326968 RepID=A0A6P6FLN3_ZIZJJ|nr:uncharacterized protein LOC107435766 [Ziziphus jujuba]KAH7517895.1 hypothetical protein FEM48_Zijuj09G0112600 [Ziziphus jujuba var. spinosa]